MIFLESNFTPDLIGRDNIKMLRPLVSLDRIRPSTIQYTTDSATEVVGKDFIYARGKQALLNELRGILLNEFITCLNPFDTVAVTTKAIAILDTYEAKLQDDIKRFDTLGQSHPNIVIKESDFNKFLSDYFAAKFIK